MVTFPREVPDDMPDIIFQMGSGLYGVCDKEEKFCENCLILLLWIVVTETAVLCR